MEGDHQAGFSVFWADDGLDTGPILLQKSCHVDINDTVDSLYNRFLFPEGIRAMVGLDGALDLFMSVISHVILVLGMTCFWDIWSSCNGFPPTNQSWY